MTGTAKTEEAEFQSIYGLDVVEIPTNKPLIRADNNDVIYGSEEGKFRAVVEEIIKTHKTGQPILVGTISVEKSELLSSMLKRRGIDHQVLNAKLHAREAEIVAQAGKWDSVTIATNMAGRGTDILLGGNPEFLAKRELRQNGLEEDLIEEATGHADTEIPDILAAREAYKQAYGKFKLQTDAEHDKVVAVGGLHIIGTERHESRRIDNQLRGRSGRQGDPGSTRFYVSLEDELMLRFGGERVKGIMEKLSPDDDIPLDLRILSKQIENAQKRVETHNFDIRKHVLQYDDVMNKQREIIYGQRRKVLMGEDVHDSVMEMIHETVAARMDLFAPTHAKPDDWDMMGLYKELYQIAGEDYTGRLHGIRERKELEEKSIELIEGTYQKREADVTAAGVDMREIERVLLLKAVDAHWMDHIDGMDQLRQGIGLQALGQKDPVVAYRNMGFDMFDEMIMGIRERTVRTLFHVSVRREAPKREQLATPITTSSETKPQPKKSDKKPGRNDPCPCGSGKKYKNCCGKNE
jgi:preprotein translocase subunit SecA